MLSSVYTSFASSLSDMSQNPVSVFIFGTLVLLIAALFIATMSPSWRNALVKIRLLERDESPTSLLTWIIGIIILVKLIQGFLIQPFIVDGGSMLPTYHNQEFLLVDKFSYLIGKPHRGDVMIFKLYEGETNPYNGKYLIKRVIGLPGEHIVVRNGVTIIYNKDYPNGFTVEESFVAYKDIQKNADVTLDDHHYFMMGDNRTQSYDSRDWGPLDSANIRGQVLFRIFPLSKLSYEPGQYKYDK